MPEGDVGILHPDVEIMATNRLHETGIELSTQSSGHPAEVNPAALTIPVVLPVDVQVTNVEIRDTAHNQLITSIEMLSPVNKREPGLTPYRLKR